MTTSYPIKEQIVQAVAAALATISVKNGYQVNVTEVQRPRITGEGFAPENLGIAIYQCADEAADDYNKCGNPAAIGRTLSIRLDLILRLSEKDARPMQQVLNFMESDVRKAVMQDPQWGGLAIDTRLGDSEYFGESTGAEGIAQMIEIAYCVSLNDPYENRVEEQR